MLALAVAIFVEKVEPSLAQARVGSMAPKLECCCVVLAPGFNVCVCILVPCGMD